MKSTSKSNVVAELHGLPVLYTPAEVAALFRVSPKTVSRWAKSGDLPCQKTLGGHRRYRKADVDRLLGKSGEEE